MKIKLTLLLLCVLLHTKKSFSQENNFPFLKDLTKMEMIDLVGRDLKIDGVSIPIYNSEGKKIEKDELMELFSTDENTIDAYQNKNKEIKAIIVRKKNESEKIISATNNDTEQSSDNANRKTKALDFTVTDINNKTYKLSNLKGKLVVINFWFTQCAPCVKELPELNKLVEKHKNSDIVFLAVTFDEKNKIEKFLEMKAFNYNITPASIKMISDYKISSYPTHLIIDETGTIVYQTTGYEKNTVTNLEAKIESLLKK